MTSHPTTPHLTTRHTLLGALAVTLVATVPTVAGAQSGSCQVTRLANRILAPVDLTFPIITAPGDARVGITVEAASGRLLLDASPLDVGPYFMPFSQALDTIAFADQVYEGTIDGAGAITVPGVRFAFCNGGIPEGTVCFPGNLCANDVTRICIRTAAGGEGCDPGVACQGVCSTDTTRSCAGDGDCPGGYCGNGTMVPFTMNLKTGTSAFGDVTVEGESLDFGSGALTLADVQSTPPESPIIGDSGITSLFLSCTLDVALNAGELPPPPVLTVKKGKVKLGAGGSSAFDDRLLLKASFTLLGGSEDFSDTDLILALGATGSPAATLRVPAGTMRANRRGNRFHVVDKQGVIQLAPPAPTGTKVVHDITVKRTPAGVYSLVLASKGLKLDDLAAAQVVTSVRVGFQALSATSAARASARRVVFP